MNLTRKNISETKVSLSVAASDMQLQDIKSKTLKKLGSSVKVPGFREGTAPPQLIEKHLDQQLFQNEFVNEAVNHLYVEATNSENLRPVVSPKITVTKFVPFTTLEFEAEVEILGRVKLSDYKKIRKTAKKAEISTKDINAVIEDIKKRMATKKDVERAAKTGDEVWIDFKGTDSKKQPISGADGKDYPLILGSDTFIPGFEENLLGLKVNDKKTFTLTFPKDYSLKALADKKVTFDVTINKVQELTLPEVNDEFAAKVGPFKTVGELKGDIKKQLGHEKQKQLDRELETEIVKEIAEKSKISVPEALVDEQLEAMLRDMKQNLAYRGQTYDEFLKAAGKTDETYRQELQPQAELRVKTGLVLAEIASEEKIDITPEELEMRLQIMKAQYKDQAAQAELDKPEARRSIVSQIMTEKTLAKLKSYIITK